MSVKIVKKGPDFLWNSQNHETAGILNNLYNHLFHNVVTSDVDCTSLSKVNTLWNKPFYFSFEVVFTRMNNHKLFKNINLECMYIWLSSLRVKFQNALCVVHWCKETCVQSLQCCNTVIFVTWCISVRAVLTASCTLWSWCPSLPRSMSVLSKTFLLHIHNVIIFKSYLDLLQMHSNNQNTWTLKLSFISLGSLKSFGLVFHFVPTEKIKYRHVVYFNGEL